MTPTLKESAIVTLIMLGTFAALMLVGFPLRFDGLMPWEMLP